MVDILKLPATATRGTRGPDCEDQEESMEEMLQLGAHVGCPFVALREFLKKQWDPSGNGPMPTPSELLRDFCEEFD